MRTQYNCFPFNFTFHILTRHSTVLLERLTVPQLLKKFHALYGTGRFVSVSEVLGNECAIYFRAAFLKLFSSGDHFH